MSKMANEKRLINVNPAYIQHILAKVPYYADEIWKFTAMTQRFPTVDAVELPCRVGDMVYRKDGSWNVVGFECDRGGSWKVKLERWKDWFRDYHERTKVSFKSFGKTVFLTREEAESALAKMDGDGNG